MLRSDTLDSERLSHLSDDHTRSGPPTIRDEQRLETAEKQVQPWVERPEKSDALIVDWEGPDDPSNPQNWSIKKKWAATVTVSLFTFISPVSSAMVAPASNKIAQEFHITNSVTIEMTTSIFVLGYALGPLVLGPLSELYGRPRVLQLANLFYLVWNIGCGFAQNTGQLVAFRLLAGIGGSAPLAIGGGVLADMFCSEERGKAVAIYTLAPILGPVIGPVCGAWIAEHSTWRWVYWSTSIMDAIIQVVGLFFLKETYAPVLLERKAEALRRDIDPERGQARQVHTVYNEDGSRSWKSVFTRAMIRPFAMLALEPIIQLIALYMAFVYGLFYLFLTSIPSIFSEVYQESSGIAGLQYISMGIGLITAAQINSRGLDRLYAYFKNKNGGVGEPEFRLPCAFVGVLIIPVGLLITGWAAQAHVHWIVTDLGIALMCAGLISGFQSLQTYIIDAFTLHAASALGAVACLRSLAGFGFPLFGPAMYRSLDYGKANTVLACLAIVLGWPGPWLFWIYGKRIRAMSRYARKPS